MSNLRIIDSQKTIGDLFNNLSKHDKIPISVHRDSEKVFAMMKLEDSDKVSPYFIFEEEFIEILEEDKVEITFFYKETFINFETKINKIVDDSYYFIFPTSICTSFKRTKTRYKVNKEDNVIVSVYGSENKYQVSDISTSGLAFEADKELFEENQSIKNMMIVLGGKQPIYVDGVIKHVTAIGDGFFRFGVKFQSIEWMVYQKIFSYIFEKLYTDIKLMKDYSVDDISSLYNKSRYIRLRNSMQDRDIMDSMLKLEKLKNKSMIAINLVQQRDGNIDAIASAIRTYNQAFYIQSILSLPDDELESIQQTDMYASITDCLLGHPYFESLLMYIKLDTDWFLEMIKIMQEIIGDKEKVLLEEYQSYKCDTNFDYEKSTFETTEVKDLEKFFNFCNNNLSVLENRTFCYKKDSFNLSDLKDVYQSMGYYISRKVFEVKRKDELLAYAVAESFSNDVDVDGMLNNVRLYILNEEFDSQKVVSSILSQASLFYKELGVENFYLYVAEKIEAKGLKNNETVNRLLMSREGVVEFLYFVKANII